VHISEQYVLNQDYFTPLPSHRTVLFKLSLLTGMPCSTYLMHSFSVISVLFINHVYVFPKSRFFALHYCCREHGSQI